MQLAIRIDVDTKIGLREGVPRLLELFSRHSVRGSFFVSFGPDNSGKALRRLRQPGFLRKMWRTNPFRLYGVRTLLSGTLLPSAPIGEGAPDILKAVIGEGHELGIHGYDHVRWQDCLEELGEDGIASELGRSVSAYERLLGTRPVSSAAPGWRCTPRSLEVQEGFRFLYASDVRGAGPFFPVHDGRIFATLQIPTTLPTVDELLGIEQDVNGFLLGSLAGGLNVHTIHAEVEGRALLSSFEKFLIAVRRRDIEIVTLRAVAEQTLEKGVDDVPRLPITRGTMPGRSGWIACQGRS